MTFIDRHKYQHAFLGNQISRLLDLIDEQSVAFLGDAAISVPSRAVSTVLMLHERGQVSTADIAAELKQPHQLATQRVEALIALGLVSRINDPKDGRRKILELTDKGKQEVTLLLARLAEAEQIFLDLSEEIQSDLSAATLRAIDALSRTPLAARAAQFKHKN